MPKKPNYPPPASWLRMPDETEELYFWFRGNPFDVQQRDPLFTALKPKLAAEGDFPLEALGAARYLEEIAGLGYMAVGKTFLMIGVDGRNANKITMGVRRMMGISHLINHRVLDSRGRIAGTANLPDRVSRVRGAEGRFAKVGLPVIEKFRLP